VLKPVPVHRKARAEAKPDKTKTKASKAKPPVKHAPAHAPAKRAPTLDLNKLSQFKSPGQ
jgi:hypothetical protein